MKKEKISITVLPEDFQGARFLDNSNCPIAKAFKREGYVLREATKAEYSAGSNYTGVGVGSVITTDGIFNTCTQRDYKKMECDFIVHRLYRVREGKQVEPFEINFYKDR